MNRMPDAYEAWETKLAILEALHLPEHIGRRVLRLCYFMPCRSEIYYTIPV